MQTWLRIVLIGAAVIVCFDTVASLASQSLGFPYYQATYGSWLIYAGIGFAAGRATNSIRRAALATAIVGAVEATIGWWISWMIGPGRPQGGNPGMVALLLAIGIVVLTAAVIGGVVGLLVRRRGRPTAARSMSGF